MSNHQYNVGDRVIVVHRIEGTNYYSYSLEGSVGTITEVKEAYSGGGWIYQIDHEDLLFRHPYNEESAVNLAKSAWYQENCLDPAPAVTNVTDEDFENILSA